MEVEIAVLWLPKGVWWHLMELSRLGNVEGGLGRLLIQICIRYALMTGFKCDHPEHLREKVKSIDKSLWRCKKCGMNLTKKKLILATGVKYVEEWDYPLAGIVEKFLKGGEKTE